MLRDPSTTWQATVSVDDTEATPVFASCPSNDLNVGSCLCVIIFCHFAIDYIQGARASHENISFIPDDLSTHAFTWQMAFRLFGNLLGKLARVSANGVAALQVVDLHKSWHHHDWSNSQCQLSANEEADLLDSFQLMEWLLNGGYHVACFTAVVKNILFETDNDGCFVCIKLENYLFFSLVFFFFLILFLSIYLTYFFYFS